MKSLNSFLDHTLLSPTATQGEIEKVCREAIEYQFRGVCVNPIWVPFVYSLIKKTEIKTVSVCDFPLGSSFTEIRKEEARMAIVEGASEVDIVMNLGLLKNERDAEILLDLKEIVGAVHPYGKLKVIIEASLLDSDEIKRASHLVMDAGADFIKTGTGTKGPVTIHQVELIRKTVNLPIKAAGGIRDKASAISLINAGAEVLGSSHSIQIVSN